MSDRRWWWWLKPSNCIMVWQLRHSEEYRKRMAGYWNGSVCRNCDRSFLAGADCPLGLGRYERPCNFHKGQRRGWLGPR